MDVRTMLGHSGRRPDLLAAVALTATLTSATAMASGATTVPRPQTTTVAEVGRPLDTGRLSTLSATPADAAGHDPTHVGASRVRIGLRLRPVGSSLTRVVADATRLTPLPAAGLPAAVLLGAVEGEQRAAFLVAGDATTWGEGTCTPPAPGCHVLELGVGQTELIDLPAPAGAQRRFALTVTSIERVHDATTAVTLRRGRTRSAAGLRALRRAVRVQAPGLGQYRWSVRRGIVESAVDGPSSAG